MKASRSARRFAPRTPPPSSPGKRDSLKRRRNRGWERSTLSILARRASWSRNIDREAASGVDMDALSFIDKAGKGKRYPIYVLHGDEDFLKRRALDALLPTPIGEADPGLAVSTYPGDKAEYSVVLYYPYTQPVLSERRVVVNEGAVSFATRNRATLEKYTAAPSASGVLVLDVKTCQSTTNLAKLVPDAATIQCKAPPAYRLPDWCI